MNRIPNRFSAQTIVFMLCLAAFLSCIAPKNISAQTSLPTFTISSEGAENGAEQQGTKNILLRERRLTLMTYDVQPQRGYVVIRRVSGSSATVTLRLGISYQDSGNRFLADNGTQSVILPALYAPQGGFPQRVPSGVTTNSLSINGLQDDLQPFLFANNLSVPVGTIGTTSQGVNQLVFNPQVQAAIIRFSARWSDQSYPRNAGIQGQRTVVVSLLPGDGYEIPSGFNALTRITLDDPANVPPVLLPAGRQFLCGQLNVTNVGGSPPPLIAIESPNLDAAGMPNAIFYDDNYDPMSYSVNTSFSTHVLSLQVQASGNSTVLSLLPLQPTIRFTSGSVTLFARDNRGGFAETTCPSVMLTTNVHEQRIVTALSAAPNPASAETQLSYTLQEPSAVQIEVYSTLGERLITIDEGLKPRGEYTTTLDVGRLATGVYPVRVRAGRVLRSVMMQVLR